MRWWHPRQLQVRLSLLLLGLLALVSGTYVYLLSQSADDYVSEAIQRRNRDLAASVASALHLNKRTNELAPGAVRQTFSAAMTINPHIKLYFLTLEGRIFNASAQPHEIKLTTVPLGPVRAFLSGTVPLPIRGADPRHPQSPRPFSAVLLRTAAGQPYCYLYITLDASPNAPEPVAQWHSYILRLLLQTLALASVAAAVIGVVLISFLTKNLQRISQAVRRLQAGDYAARVEHIRSGDELGELATAFNDMAARTEQAVAALHNNDELRRELVANISHDLRTPLASIEGYTETILHQQHLLSEAERVSYLSTILKNTQRLKRLVSELFELSKLEAQQSAFQPEPFALPELVQDVLLALQPAAQAQGLHLAADIPTPVPLVYADVALLERVLQNLLDNALRFTPAGGRVLVRVLPPAAGLARVRLEVQDTGRGIAPADLPHVFDRFYRSDHTRAVGDGLGLGLAIASRIVALHGSELTVSSTEGQGTCFAFLVPVYTAGAPR